MTKKKSGKLHNMTSDNGNNLLPVRTGTIANTITQELAVNTAEIQPAKGRGRGYGKPFPPGHCGNPDGRPKGSRNFNILVTEALQKLGAKDAQGNPLPVEEALVQKIIKMALDGDRKMIEMIWNYRDGKPPQNIDLTSKGERVGTVILSAEEEKRIEELFAPRILLPSNSKENANDKLQSNKSDGADNSGGNEIPNNEQPRSAYESNS